MTDLLCPDGKYNYPLVFTSLQEHFIDMVVLFLKHNRHYQAHTWDTQEKLLMKNICDITIILMAMYFDRERQIFRYV